MRFAIWMPIMLRVASGLVFVVAVIVAGAANRSAIMVPALAGVATLAHLNTPRLSLNLGGAPKQGLIGRAMTVFFTRTLVFGLVFGLSVLIAALFRETHLARDFTNFDIGLLVVPFALALVFTTISMRSPLGNPQAFMEDIQKAFAEMQAGQGMPSSASDDDDFTFDGEFEDVSNDR